MRIIIISSAFRSDLASSTATEAIRVRRLAPGAQGRSRQASYPLVETPSSLQPRVIGKLAFSELINA